MRILISVFTFYFLCGCAGARHQADVPREPVSIKGAPMRDLRGLQTALGLSRPVQELGMQEKIFDSCRARFKESGVKCGTRYLTVLNFRLMCRDSEGTVDVVTNTKPLISDHVEYQIAGVRGVLKSDDDGFLQLTVVTNVSVRGQRLVVTIGRQFFGKEISEIDALTLPDYWCQ